MRNDRYSIFGHAGDSLRPSLKIQVATLSRLRSFSCQDTEAGGLLLGSVIPALDAMEVSQATEPGGRDRRRKFGFHRSGSDSTRIAKAAWHASDGIVHILGEWHTHPEDEPTPSLVDYRNMLAQLRGTTVVYKGLFMLVAGRQSFWVEFFPSSGVNRCPAKLREASLARRHDFLMQYPE